MLTEAQKQYKRWYAQTHKEKVREYKKKYREKIKSLHPKLCAVCGKVVENRHKKRCDSCYALGKKEAHKRYVAKNQDKLKKSRHQWYILNKKRILAQQKKYRESLR